jgi:hypothetical protein
VRNCTGIVDYHSKRSTTAFLKSTTRFFSLSSLETSICLAPIIHPEGPDQGFQLWDAPTATGLQDSALGFNPGNLENKRFALKLKGREASR